jgi:hypothetical protein
MFGPDRFGYYQTENLRSYSKVELLEIASKTKKSVEWNFNEDVYSKFDWKIEPIESLQELYFRRARMIREKYDYIVVFYSGGADSNNVLNSFLQQGLFVDEIAQMHSYEGDGTWDSYFNEEVAKVAVPYTQKVLEQSPLTKHRLIDQTKLIADVYKKDSNHLDFVYKVNAFMAPNALARSYIRESVKDYQDIISSGKKLCFVWGSEKPMIDKVDGKYCVRFNDGIDNCVSPRTQMLNREWENDELFYWCPDMPEIVCKQAHILMRYLRSINLSNIDYYIKGNWITTDRSAATPNNVVPMKNLFHEGKQYYLPNTSMHPLIYPWWDVSTFSNGKPSSIIFSERDIWWFKDKHDKFQNLYSSGMSSLIKSLGTDRFFYGLSGQGSLKRLRRMTSKPYFIE